MWRWCGGSGGGKQLKCGGGLVMVVEENNGNVVSQLHFNNVTSHALFCGGHLVMSSKRCAVQNQGITLITGSLK